MPVGFGLAKRQGWTWPARSDRYHVSENIHQNLGGRLIRIDMMDEVLAVEVEHGLGFPLISVEPLMDDLQAGIVQAVFLERTALNAGDQILQIAAFQIENADNIERVLEHFGLADTAGNAIENKRILLRAETTGPRIGFDRLSPQLDRDFVRNQFAAAGIFDEDLPDLTLDGEVSENIPARTVIKMRNVAKDLALSAFARAGRAEEEYRAVFHLDQVWTDSLA